MPTSTKTRNKKHNNGIQRLQTPPELRNTIHQFVYKNHDYNSELEVAIGSAKKSKVKKLAGYVGALKKPQENIVYDVLDIADNYEFQEIFSSQEHEESTNEDDKNSYYLKKNKELEYINAPATRINVRDNEKTKVNKRKKKVRIMEDNEDSKKKKNDINNVNTPRKHYRKSSTSSIGGLSRLVSMSPKFMKNIASFAIKENRFDPSTIQCMTLIYYYLINSRPEDCVKSDIIDILTGFGDKGLPLLSDLNINFYPACIIENWNDNVVFRVFDKAQTYDKMKNIYLTQVFFRQNKHTKCQFDDCLCRHIQKNIRLGGKDTDNIEIWSLDKASNAPISLCIPILK